ncbi:MAG: cbb3-type cytochrome c oxidase subunit I [Candidatus Aramenus sulfurataquae]|jgi:cytochrome c oxidase subunit 1/terminal oxidase heme-binding subunit I|uniref:Oxidase n=2 Tax=Candidatus Aramenus sulfurataquae TaxID=1326980 RepID=A0A0F2LRI0_9CREN|nr:cbb3-type cytochrome c oxidase subunit I [Candidatus Aramenus sulfurataquae]
MASVSKGFLNLVNALFQLDKPWLSRITMGMIVLSLVWGILGIVDALMVRIQEATWAVSASLLITSQEYYGSVALHAMRDLFGFAVQLEFAIFIFLSLRMLNLEPRAKWLLNVGFILFNTSFMLIEGPIVAYPVFNDNYFPSNSWYYLSPYGLPEYSQYVISPLWYFGWELMDIGTYIFVIWLVYHFYLATKTRKEKLPIFAVFALMTALMTGIGWSGELAANTWDILAYYGITGLNVIANQIAFGILWHSIVYIVWMPAVGALYYLIPLLANKPIYSDKMARIAALLYLIFSNNVPIHHLYMVDLPATIKILEEVLTYAVVVPSMLTFFNLWATVKGANVNINLISAWTIISFAGAIAAGVTGISNATISFDAMIHDSMWVPGHFHAMIFWSIVPAGFATLYYMIPMLTGRMWHSNKLGWIHMAGYMVGTAMLIVGFDALGVSGLVRKAEVFPLIPAYITPEVVATVGAFIADVATLGWLGNLMLTLLKGRTANFDGVSVDEVVPTIAMSLGAPSLKGATKPLNVVKSKVLRAMRLEK